MLTNPLYRKDSPVTPLPCARARGKTFNPDSNHLLREKIKLMAKAAKPKPSDDVAAPAGNNTVQQSGKKLGGSSGKGFMPGQSGNPSGRPAVVKHIQELARQHTPEAVSALVAALKKPGERVAAADKLLAYGYGRPAQTVTVRQIKSIEDLSMDELLAIVNGERPSDGDSIH